MPEPSPIVAGAALSAYGVGTSTGMIAYQSTLQTVVPAEVRGRAFALYDVLWNAARLVSLGLGGIIADQLSIRAVYFVSAALLAIAAAIGLTVPLETSGLNSREARMKRRLERHVCPICFKSKEFDEGD